MVSVASTLFQLSRMEHACHELQPRSCALESGRHGAAFAVEAKPLLRRRRCRKESKGTFRALCTFLDLRTSQHVFLERSHTANVLSVEYINICLCCKSKNKHWLFLHAFVCNGQQIFSCCFYFESNTKFIER